MRRSLLVCIALTISMLHMVSAPNAYAELFGEYAGYKSCIECHPEISEGWLKTPHAHAFQTLAKQGEEKLKNPGCVKCHVVAMDADGGFIDLELTPELKDVQCESCHGPGLKHNKSQDPKDIIGKPKEDCCRVCHTPEQDKNFDFKLKSLKVHGDYKPKDKK